MGNILHRANVNNFSRVKLAFGASAFHSFCQNEFARLPLINHFPSLIWWNCPPLMSRLLNYSFKKYHLPPVWLGSDGKWMLMRCFDYVSPMWIIFSIVGVGVPRILAQAYIFFLESSLNRQANGATHFIRIEVISLMTLSVVTAIFLFTSIDWMLG